MEGLLNNRPIGYIHHKENEDEVITPQKFLTGHAAENLVPIHNSPKIPFGPRYKQMCEAVRRFWKRFVLEYIPSLHGSRIWLNTQKNLAKGDRVLLLEPEGPGGEYPVGKVTEVFKGRDGLVRKAAVEMAEDGKEKIRHVRKLRLLRLPHPDEVEDEEEAAQTN